MKRLARVALALTLAAMVIPTVVAAQAKPVVAVMYFDNNSIGKDRADFEGVGKGMAELIINDMLSNPNVRVVERERVQSLLVEQNMVKGGQIDPQTAIKLGKIIGAQYMITGAFMSTATGVVLSARSINVETSAITNPVRVNAKGDDVLAMISQLTEKMAAEMKLPALRTADAGAASATPAGTPASAVASTPASSTPAATKTASASAEKPATKATPAASKQAKKMDMKTAMLYSKALEAEDAGNKAQAVELYNKVLTNFPDYPPVKAKLNKLKA
jgi:TolB-like protein